MRKVAVSVRGEPEDRRFFAAEFRDKAREWGWKVTRTGEVAQAPKAEEVCVWFEIELE